ncbi:HPF/RaiA family ribosome-associated protein [Chamaesiphon polymorphus]|uniref:RNA polymerase subunit sigma-54 n=1 Tax=Chamaesiphon polymorphus CCALA 037 TaxID=2107692 RepID=A0A2T1GDP9_9CYAN|nr:HPF/RaiA family ribosome-associated protein [Chamaesiphon polymorphus]PSB55633.1 RNA polymerase subunit sigma-54 [Chamaesiphon polymorphus CCALA 037]
MRANTQIFWQNLSPSDAIEVKIRKQIAKLEKFSEHLSDCRVIIEVPHRHQHQGNIYHVQINLTVPGNQLIVNRQPSAQQSHEDLDLAIRDAFESAERQLKEYTRQRRGDIKTPAGGETDDERRPISQSH